MPETNETRLSEQPLEHPLLDHMIDVVYGNSNTFHTVRILSHAQSCPKCNQFIRNAVEKRFQGIKHADWDKTPPEYVKMSRELRNDILNLIGSLQ